MHIWKRIWGVSALMATLIAAPGVWAESGVTEDEIVLGASLAFTGGPGALAYAGLVGQQIAVGEINAAGGVNGRMVRIIAEDDDYIPARTVQAVTKLIEQDDVFGLLGASSSSNWLAILPMLEEMNVPSINPLMASMEPIHAGPNTHFSIGMGYRDGAHELMTALIEQFPEVKWASILRDDETGIDHERGFLSALEAAGQDAVLTQRFRTGQTDFSVEVLKAREAGATGLFVGILPSDVASIMSEAERLEMDAVFATLWISHIDAMINLVGANGSRLYLYDYVPSLDDPSLADFRALAATHLSAEDQARMNRYSVTGYATMRVFLEAMSQCGDDLTRVCAIEKLQGLQNYDTGVTQPVSFSPDNHLAVTPGQPLTIDADAGRFVPASW